MAWQAIDFQGISSFEKALANQLRLYLEEKQTHLSQVIADSIPSEVDASNPVLEVAQAHRKLSDGVEAFTRKVSQTTAIPSINEEQWQAAARKINAALWEYAELLQSVAVELFQQLDLVGIEQWRPEVLKVVDSIKEILLHNMEDLKWAIKRLESQLWEYKRATSNPVRFEKFLSYFKPLWGNIIDHTIVKNLEKSQKFLGFRYQNFQHRYEQYIELNDEIEKKMSKFQTYNVLATLDPEEQDSFKRLYRLLKLWKANKQAKALPNRELVRVLRYAITPEKAATFFKNYYNALQNKLFSQSRNLKDGPSSAENNNSENENNEGIDGNQEDLASDTPSMLELQSALSNQRFELHTLGATISAYRSFLLESDPNPYVRTRGGFSEWIVGHEPSQTKSLVEQEYDIERLDALYLQFLEFIKPSHEDSPFTHQQIYSQIESTLHDMGQPLASNTMMHVRAQHFVTQLKQLNELGTRDPEVTKHITPLLSKAMRADWKYHVLHEIPLFHQLYAVHMKILPALDDRQHTNRLKHFKRLLQQLQQWVQDKSTLAHMHEIELDINDIKGYLQDFLAQLQRIARDMTLFTKSSGEAIMTKTAHELLEYRYLFGHFFHRLRQTEMDERLMRNQFLFVDHYFETVENKLVDMQDELKRMEE